MVDTDTTQTPQSRAQESRTGSVSTQNVRQKNDPAWNHCEVIGSEGANKVIKCRYCGKSYKGGGIHRMKEHLARRPGKITGCPKVPIDVHIKMKGNLKDIEMAKTEKANVSILHESEGEEESQNLHVSGKEKKRKKPIGSYMKDGSSSGVDLSQPSIQASWNNKERKHETDMAVALWFYDACIPMNAVNSRYFKPMMSRIASMGHGYTGPNYHALRVPLLKEAKAQVHLTIESMRSNWIESGCTIMGDGWTDRSHRSLNPAFQYDPNNSLREELSLAYKGIIEIIGDLHSETNGIMNEVTMFREAKKSFGITLAKKEAKKTTPDEWWRLFGIDAPNLQKLAIRILSQTSSSSGCERNWSVFERIHTKKRNRFEHERLNDLVFVHYNLRLKNRDKEMHKTYDPIDYECIDKVDTWIIDEEPNGELDYDEIMEVLDNEDANNEIPEPQEGDENVDKEILNDHVDLTNFGLGSMGSSSRSANLNFISD